MHIAYHMDENSRIEGLRDAASEDPVFSHLHSGTEFADWMLQNLHDKLHVDVVWTEQKSIHKLPLTELKKRGIMVMVTAPWLSREVLTPGVETSAYELPNFSLVEEYADVVETPACQAFVDEYYDGWRKLGKVTISNPHAANTERFKDKYRWPKPKIEMLFCGKETDGETFSLFIEPVLPHYTHINLPSLSHGVDAFQHAGVCVSFGPASYRRAKYMVPSMVYNALASRAFCISDLSLAVVDAFSDSELCIAHGPSGFWELLHRFIKNQEKRDLYINEGFDRVMLEHTYYHRIDSLVRSLNG
jgi:hypothetical protein